MTPDLPPPDDDDPTRSHRPADENAPTLPPNPDARPPRTHPPAEYIPDGGRYRVLREHSAKIGGMGRVHRATDTELQRTVALKDIRPEFAERAHFCEQFLLEAEITGQLEHPGVVPVYGLGRDANGRPFYAMRFIDGPTLDEVVRQFHATAPIGRARSVGLRQLLARFVSVCQTLAFAHSKQVIHRDLKPGNVMLGRFGETLVMDWGMVKRAGTARPGTGTGGYWAPEQAAMLFDVQDERTDVYGLGAILFHLLTDQSPHPDGLHPPDPPSPRAVTPWVDGVLDAITRKALATRPEDRYPSAAELATAVEEWLADQPVVAQRELVEGLRRQVDGGQHALAERLARETFHLGLILAGMGRDGEAAGLFQRAADGYERRNARRPEPRLQAEQANCLLAAARSFERISGDALAEQCKQQAAELLRLIIATSPNDFEVDEASVMLTHIGQPADRRRPAEPPPDDQTREIGVASPPATPAATPVAPPTEPPPAHTDPAGDSLHTLPPDDAPSDTVWPPPPAHPPAAPVDDAPGGFTPIRELGRGGMGSVLLAWDNRLSRLVAIKVLRSPSADDTFRQARFRREMRLTAGLDHPNIVKVYSAGERADGSPFLVMEHLDGANLSHRLREGEPGWAHDRLDPFAQVCDALHFAHTHGIVHHDPKPGNVILLTSGRAVLHDWGLARRTGDSRAGVPAGVASQTDDDPGESTGSFGGTPVYMAPERWEGKGEATADVYSVGAGLFEAVAGRHAAQGGSMAELMAQVLERRTPRLRDVRPDVPAELDAIVTRAMAFDPADRYPTAAAMAADLRAFLARQAG